MNVILGLIALYVVLKPKQLKFDLTLKVKSDDDSSSEPNDRKSDD